MQTIIAFLHKKDRTGSHPYGRPVLFKPTPEMTSAFSISDRPAYKPFTYRHAASAAMAPSAAAVVTWRTVFERQSPATNTPGVFVTQVSFVSK